VAVGPDRPLLAWLCALAVLSGLVESVCLYLIARLATAFAAGHREVDLSIGPLAADGVSLGRVAAISAVTIVGTLLLGLPLARSAAVLSRRTLVRARTRLVRTYLDTPWEERAQHGEGHLQELVGEYCQRAERFVQQLSTIVTAAVSIAALAAVALVITPVGAAVALLALVVIGVLLRPVAGRVRHGSVELKDVNKRIAGRVAQTARVGQEITAFDVEQQVGDWLVEDIERGGHVTERIRYAARITPLLYQSGTLALVVLVAWGLLLVDTADVDAFAPMLLLLMRALGYGKQLQTATQTATEIGPYVSALEEEIATLAAAPRMPGGHGARRFAEIRLRDVGYEYLPGRPALRGIDLRIRRGDAIGVIGPSGGGKSTLVQLLLRVRRPTSGVIEVDGQPLATIDHAAWSRLVAFVPQDNKLIRGTVADNVRFYRSELSAADVVGACRSARVHDEIVALPEGYETEVGPGAHDLSGGQRQRLGIARALVGRPHLIVLDEPTSALDATSERLIRDTLAALKDAVTLIIIAHRPATLEICDRAIEIRAGEVVARRVRRDSIAARGTR
jgi:ATP-binding cassette, subfamily B, bacterial